MKMATLWAEKRPLTRKRTLWSYVDARDAATACHLAAEADHLGAVALNIAADDSIMTIKSRALMAAEYPEVNDFRTPLMNHESLTSNTKAKRVLLWQPLHSWRHHVPALR
jgi:nucleoside-diphosphate-sugar epimerase